MAVSTLSPSSTWPAGSASSPSWKPALARRSSSTVSSRRRSPLTGTGAPPGRWQHTGGMSGTGVVVLDGGLSNALTDRGHDLAGALWTARLLRDAPEEIAAVHRAYFAAGARVATTASYQASLTGLVGAGLAPREAAGLIRLSVRLARDVVAELSADGVERFVAASVGPYGAYLADGSEYRGAYGIDKASLRDFHAPRLELLAAEQPDLIAVET